MCVILQNFSGQKGGDWSDIALIELNLDDQKADSACITAHSEVIPLEWT